MRKQLLQPVGIAVKTAENVPQSHDPGKQPDKHDRRQWNKVESHGILWNIQGVFSNFVRTLLDFLEHHGIFQNIPKKEMEYS